MAEQLDLTNPEVKPQVTTAFYRVVYLLFDWRVAQIVVHLEGQNGEIKSFGYVGAEATALMVLLNKANLSTNSLQKRVLDKLRTDGKIAGTVSGAPD